MNENIKSIIKLPLIVGITFFISSILFYIFTRNVSSNLSWNTGALILFIYHCCLYFIFITTLFLLLFANYKIYTLTTKNIAITLVMGLFIFGVKLGIDITYSSNAIYFARYLQENIGIYEQIIVIHSITPIKTLLTLTVITLACYLLTFLSDKTNLTNSSQELSTIPLIDSRTAAICYSILITITFMLLSILMLGLAIAEPLGYYKVSYVAVLIIMIIISSIVLIIHYFLIYCWANSCIPATNNHPLAIVVAFIISLLIYLLSAILNIITVLATLNTRFIYNVVEWLPANATILILLAFIITFGSWLILITRVKTPVFIAFFTIYMIVNFLLITFTLGSTTGSSIVISGYMISLSIGLLLLYFFTYLAIKLAYKLTNKKINHFTAS